MLKCDKSFKAYMRESENSVSKESDQRSMKIEEGNMCRIRRYACAFTGGSPRVLHNKVWLQRERLIRK